MSKNVAEIEIKTINNTNAGLDAVSTNFDNLDKKVQNLEKNLKPLKAILDGGLAVGTSVAGIASLTKNSGNLTGAVSDLKSSLLGIQSAAENAGGSMGGFLGGVAETVLTASAQFTRFVGIVRGAVQVGQKVAGAYQAIKTITAEVTAVTQAATLAKTTSTAATVAETVAEAADAAAKTATTSASATEAAATTASATAKVENTVATVAETTAEAAGSVAKGASTAATTGETVATGVNTAAKGGNAAATASLAVANVAGAASAGIFTKAMTVLNVVMASNPIVFIVTAITAAIAAIAMITIAVFNWCVSEEKAAEATQKALDATKAQTEANAQARDVCGQYASRLELLASKENMTAEEQAEAAKMVEELNERYKGLNLTLDDAANGFEGLKKAMAMEAVADAESEIEALEKHLAALEHDYSVEKKKWFGKEGDIAQQMEETQKQLDDAKKRRTDSANEITKMEIAERKKVNDAVSANAKLEADLRREIADETKTALQKELDGVDEKIALREKELDKLREQGVLTQEQYDSEMQNLKAVGDERKKQIEERHKKEAEKKAQEAAESAKKARQQADDAQTAWEEKKSKAAQTRTEKSEDEKFDLLVKTNPLAALEYAKANAAESVAAVATASAAKDSALAEARADGSLSDDEKRNLEKLEKEYDEAVRQNERYQQKLKSADDAFRTNVSGLLKTHGSTPSSPIDAFQQGTMEAFRKEIELKSQEKKSPEAISLEAIRTLLLARFRNAETEASREREQMETLTGSLVGL